MIRDTFLPDDLRPVQQNVQPTSHVRALLVLLVVAALVSSVPAWRLRRVEIRGGDCVPVSTIVSLEELVGTPLILLSFGWIRRSVQVWPQVGNVDVKLELSGVLRLNVRPKSVRASVPIGNGWHGVGRDGSLSGRLKGPQYPVLVGFPLVKSELRRALTVVDRVKRASGDEVVRIRRITPADFELQIDQGDKKPWLCVRVTPAGSRSEDLWCEARLRGTSLAAWSDLRRDDRLVVGGAL